MMDGYMLRLLTTARRVERVPDKVINVQALIAPGSIDHAEKMQVERSNAKH